MKMLMMWLYAVLAMIKKLAALQRYTLAVILQVDGINYAPLGYLITVVCLISSVA